MCGGVEPGTGAGMTVVGALPSFHSWGEGRGRRGILRSANGLSDSPLSPALSPRTERGRRAAGRALALTTPKTKRGPAFPPALRCRHPLACPSGRRARCGGGMQCSASGKGLRNPAFQRSRCVRWPVTGTGAVPKNRVPASMSLRFLRALRRSGIAIRSSIDTIPEGSFHSITSRRFGCPKASSSVAAVAASSWPCPKAPPLRCNPLHPVRRRALRPWLPVRPAARKHRPLPFRLSPPTQGREVPLDACPFRSRRVDANIVTAVSRGGVPVPIRAVSRRHLHGSGRDKHLISLWFPAAASSACPMMLSRFSSRAKRRSTVTICG